MRIRSVLCFVVVTSLLSSCAPSLYFPEKVVTTGFSAKNQVFINASLKPQSTDSEDGAGNSFSLAASGSYSFASNWAGYFAYSNVSKRTVKVSDLPNHWGWNSITGGTFNGNRYELGLVYFKKCPQKRSFEFAAGYSFGDLKRTSDFKPELNFDTRYFTVFMQPSWSIRKSAYFLFGAGMKIWYQQFTKLNASASTTELFQSGEKDLTDIPYFFLCPFMNFEAGIPFVKFNTQIGFPLDTRSTKDQLLSGFPMYLTFGLTFRLEKSILSGLKKTSPPKRENLL